MGNEMLTVMQEIALTLQIIKYTLIFMVGWKIGEKISEK